MHKIVVNRFFNRTFTEDPAPFSKGEGAFFGPDLYEMRWGAHSQGAACLGASHDIRKNIGVGRINSRVIEACPRLS